MPTVPYKSYPDVVPSDVTTPAYNLRVPDAAFGSAVGAATQGLGRSLEGVGDMLHKHAMEQQALENDTWVKNAFTAAETKIGERTAAYKETEGVDATNARPGFVEGIQKDRQEALDSAPNPAARRALDGLVTRKVGYAVVDAAGHSATQAKHANNEATLSSVKYSMETYDPSAPDAADKMKNIETQTRKYWATKGLGDVNAINAKIDENQQTAMANGVAKYSGVDPAKAQALWNAVKEKVTIPNLRNTTEAKINSNAISHGVVTESQKLLDGEEVGPSGTSIGRRYNPETDQGNLGSIREAAEAAGEELGKGVPGFKEAFTRTVMSQVAQRNAEYSHVKTARMKDMLDFTSGQGDPNKRITSEAGIQADPKYSKVWATMNDQEKNSIRGVIDKANHSAEPRLGDPGVEAEVGTWNGIADAAKNGDPIARKKLEDANIMENPLLTSKAKSEIMNAKLHLTGKDDANPIFERYMKESRAMLNKFGMVAGSADEKKADDYYNFRNAFKAEVTAWQEEHGGKPPLVKDREAMIQRLIKDQVKIKGGGWGGFFDSLDTRYKVYSQHRDEMIDDYMQSHNGQSPTESELQRAFNKAYPDVK